MGCGQRRLSRAVATPGAGPHPRGSSHCGADKAGWTLERPGGCALGSGGSATRAGDRGPASAGLFGTARGMGSSSPECRPGTRSLPQAWREPGSRRVGRVGAVAFPGRGAEAGCRPRSGAAGEQVSGPRTSRILYQEQAPHSDWPFSQPCPQVVGGTTAWSHLGVHLTELRGETAGAEWKSSGLWVNGGSRRCVNGPRICILLPLTEEGLLQGPKDRASL